MRIAHKLFEQLYGLRRTANDEELVAVASQLAHKEHGTMLLWIAAASLGHSGPPGAARVLAHTVIDGDTDDVTTSLALLLLVSSPPIDDSTVLNVCSALVQTAELPNAWQRMIAQRVPSFLLSAMERGPLVIEAVVNLLITPDVTLCTKDTQARLQLLIDAATSYVERAELDDEDEELRSEWREALGEQRRLISKLTVAVPRNETATLYEAERVLRRTLSGADKAMEVLPHAFSRLRVAAKIETLDSLKAIVQRLVLRGNELTTEIVTKVARAWSILYSTDEGELSLRPAEASTGSFVLRVEVVGDAAKANEVFSEIQQSIDSPDAHPMLAPRLAMLARLLDDHDISLYVEQEIEHTSQDVAARRSLSLDEDKVPRLRNRLASLPADKIFSANVPQADRLDRVVRLTALLASGERVDSDSLEVTPRQVNYYRHAAQVLGVVDDDGSLTSAGRGLSRMTGAQQTAALLVYFQGSTVGNAWIEWSRGATLRDVQPGTAEKFLRNTVIDLSPSTIQRRARTLESWRHDLVVRGQAQGELFPR